MTIAEHLTRSGDALFRSRSWMPLLLAPLLLGSLVHARYPFDSHAADTAWEMACFLLALGGLAIRVVTVATTPRGTSGRSTRTPKATALNTTGAYSVVRHPLYLANCLVALGVSCFSRTWYLPLIVGLAALLYYERIAFREEQYLEKRFGDEFLDWTGRTPAIVPNFRLYEPPAMPFNWRKVLRNEYDGLLKVAAPFFALDVVEDLAVTGELTIDPLWTGLLVLGAVLFLVLRAMKKRGLLPDPDDQRSSESAATRLP